VFVGGEKCTVKIGVKESEFGEREVSGVEELTLIG